MAGKGNIILRESQRLTSCDANLLAHNINTRNHLCDGVLNLYPRVHFDEVKTAVFVQELEGPSSAVANGFAGVYAAFANGLPQLVRNARRRGFLDDFLVSALK